MIEPLAGGGLVQVGQLVELTREEQRELEEASALLYSLARHRKRGWFTPYVQTVTKVNRLIRSAVSRSHAT